jgi:hypothetical protein
MNTMPFPDGSQEVPHSLLVALPEFLPEPLNGRTAAKAVETHQVVPNTLRGRSW